ncbi:MAG: Fis family transcriptional regulator [Zoogloeaceae bacterium]|jgi:Fis family transcriptional regulator|nr:Fis family transcriptional regulator [Zoogloeaceae bacterium]
MSQPIQAEKCPIEEIRQYEDISRCVRGALEQYFRDLDGEKPNTIYNMVIKSVERPMLEIVLRQSNGNQTQAAEMLGINRNTLRKKLAEFQLV